MFKAHKHAISWTFGAGLWDLQLCLCVMNLKEDSVRFICIIVFIFPQLNCSCISFDCLLIKRHAQNTIKILWKKIKLVCAPFWVPYNSFPWYYFPVPTPLSILTCFLPAPCEIAPCLLYGCQICCLSTFYLSTCRSSVNKKKKKSIMHFDCRGSLPSDCLSYWTKQNVEEVS